MHVELGPPTLLRPARINKDGDNLLLMDCHFHVLVGHFLLAWFYYDAG